MFTHFKLPFAEAWNNCSEFYSLHFPVILEEQSLQFNDYLKLDRNFIFYYTSDDYYTVKLVEGFTIKNPDELIVQSVGQWSQGRLILGSA